MELFAEAYHVEVTLIFELAKIQTSFTDVLLKVKTDFGLIPQSRGLNDVLLAKLMAYLKDQESRLERLEQALNPDNFPKKD